MKMKRLKKLVSAGLICSMLVSTALSQNAWAAGGVKEREKTEKKTYTVTLDSNGGYFYKDYVDEEEDETGKGDVASGSNASVASGSDYREEIGRTDSENKYEEKKIEVPDGTDIRYVIENIKESVRIDETNTYLMGWTTVKDDIMTNVYRDAMYGGIGIEEPLIVHEDVTLHALWFRVGTMDSIADGDGWGNLIGVDFVRKDGETPDQDAEISKVQMEEAELKKQLQSLDDAYETDTIPYDSVFQVELSGITEKDGVFIYIRGANESQKVDLDKVYLFEMSSDGQNIVGEVPVLRSEYGDDTGAEGTNLAFVAEHSGSYMVIPMGKTVEVTVENVKGGFIMAEYSTVNEDGEWVSRYLPIGESVKVPVGTELALQGIPFSDCYLMGLNHAERDVFDEMPTVHLDSYIFKTDKEKRVSAELESTPIYSAFEDTVISAEFVKDDSEEEGDTTEKKQRLYIGLEKPSFSKAGKIETEVFVYDGKRTNRIAVENIKLSSETGRRNDNDLFEMEGNILKSLDELAYGTYRLYFEFDYDGQHYSGENTHNAYIRTTTGITVGSVANFEGYLAMAHFNGKDYYISESAFMGTSVITSPDTKYSEVLSQADSKDLNRAEIVNYTFEDWQDKNGKAIPADQKLGTGLDVVAKYVNEKGETYRAVIYPLSGTIVDPDDGGSGGGDSSGGNSGGGSSSGGSSFSGSKSSVPTAMSGQWQQEGTDWKFLKSNGSYARNEWGYINARWYYFGDDTVMQTKWVLWNGIWYYMNPQDGSMSSGWIQELETGDFYYLDEFGAMITGWKEIDHKWYYLNPVSDGSRGKMVKNQWIGEYYVNESGTWVQ